MYQEFNEIPNSDILEAIVGFDPNVSSANQIKLVETNFIGEGSNVGDGLTSAIKAIEIKYRIDRCSVETMRSMAKIRVTEGRCAKWWNAMKFFDREIELYLKLLPELQSLASQCGITFPCAKIYFCKLGGNHILMEDFKLQNYKLIQDINPNLKFSMTRGQVLAVLDFCAKFHAVGYKYLQEVGMDKFKENFPLIENAGRLGQFLSTEEETTQENREMYLTMSKEIVTILREIYPDQSVVDKFEKAMPNLAEVCGQTRHPEGHKFLVIAHGDLWSNNILFKAPGDKEDDFKVFDFQECMVSRPTADIGVLLCNSVTPKVRRDHLQEFLAFYHEHLCQYLESLGFECPQEKIYSKHQLENDYETNFGHGFYWGIMNALGCLKTDGLVGAHLEKEESKIDASTFDKNNLPDGAERLVDLVRAAHEYGYFDVKSD